MITFTPLSGGARLSKTIPLSYLLQVDDVRILLDCGSPGWCPEHAIAGSEDSSDSQSFSWESYCKALKECAPTVDLVLISHGDLQHAGLYAYAYAHWGLRAPTYTTLPVQATARLAAVEEAESIRSEEDVDNRNETSNDAEANDRMDVDDVLRRKFVPSPDDVREAYDSIHTLRYSQPAHLQGKCQGLTITAFNAGHTLGGTIWKIRSPSAGTILYAVDLNHLRERHLDGTVILRGAGAGGVYEALARPDLMITDADRVNNISCRKKDRDAQLIDTVTSTLSSRHSVLMPCDSSTRLLELLVLLDQHWTYSRFKFPICLVSRTGREMLTFVRSMMEWLGGTISKEDVGEDTGNNANNKRRRDDDNEEEALGALALRFKYLEFFPNPQALLHTYSSKDPKLILAVPVSLSHGSSRSIFSEFASVADNVVLLTSPGEDGTLARTLFDMWNDEQREDDKWNKGKLGRNVMLDKTLKLTMKSKVPLQGVELEEYLKKERAAKEKEAAEEAALARTQRMLEADEGDSESDDSEDEDAVEQTLDDMMDVSDDHDGLSPVFAEPGAGGGRRRSRKEADTGDWSFETEDGSTKPMLSFDIYMKGNVSKQSSFFKTEGPQQQRFRMFPYVERRRRVDSYGEVLDVGLWLRKGKLLEEEAESEESKEAKRKKEEEEEAKKAPAEPPSKYISYDVDVQLACRLLFVDMEGLNDGRAVKKIAAHVNPRKLIIVHSSSDGAQSLIEACGAVRALTKEIYAPDIGEQVQIGQHTNSYSISLSEELLASVRMSNFEDNEVGFIQGCIASLASSTIPILEPVSNLTSRLEDVPMESEQLVKPARLGSRPATKLPRSTMIGDLKLTALKARLSKMGVHTEFAGEGVLLCRNSSSDEDVSTESIVAVRKKADGKVELEGTVTEVYYTVRRAIYELHALVAA
ncbi:cleavage and polyadenylation specificity factor subunit [Fomitiporia mediterranea MF3/22]|uniref:cleavage and polyadenylation specificity factor subunit n=1 Tax=Fomitiporia mediterranea (strain MF3/22) TaxID=694068 RepID=UPI000440857C|nr:cleavage and polyadenylation specificity factor subunit [Fomitiporia mediterranea MF3/22]EJD01140.1 cleavage and polyadenylation specificity factor subunit [Fomitiporia mediterranea MF3/22]